MLEIRPAIARDDAALVAIDDLTWSPSTSPAPAPSGPRLFFDRVAPADVLVAVLDGELVGYGQLHNPIPLPAHAHVLELNGLAVHPAAARHGVGAALIEALVAEAKRRGARKLSLRVLGPNAPARRLYDRTGFVVEGVLRGEFRIGTDLVDDVLMARYLEPATS